MPLAFGVASVHWAVPAHAFHSTHTAGRVHHRAHTPHGMHTARHTAPAPAHRTPFPWTLCQSPHWRVFPGPHCPASPYCPKNVSQPHTKHQRRSNCLKFQRPWETHITRLRGGGLDSRAPYIPKQSLGHSVPSDKRVQFCSLTLTEQFENWGVGGVERDWGWHGTGKPILDFF